MFHCKSAIAFWRFFPEFIWQFFPEIPPNGGGGGGGISSTPPLTFSLWKEAKLTPGHVHFSTGLLPVCTRFASSLPVRIGTLFVSSLLPDAASHLTGWLRKRGRFCSILRTFYCAVLIHCGSVTCVAHQRSSMVPVLQKIIFAGSSNLYFFQLCRCDIWPSATSVNICRTQVRIISTSVCSCEQGVL